MENKVTISNGNSKIGKTINISMPPIEACGKNLPCFKQCYALKSYRQYPNVRKAWGGNYEMYKNHPEEFWNQIRTFLNKTKRKYFRWHVAGDILDQVYLDTMIDIAAEFPDIKFKVATKRYDLIYPMETPVNFFLWFSTWPGLDLPGIAPRMNWLSHDERKPKYTFKCTGLCDDCRYCWGEGKDKHMKDVEFELH